MFKILESLFCKSVLEMISFYKKLAKRLTILHSEHSVNNYAEFCNLRTIKYVYMQKGLLLNNCWCILKTINMHRKPS